MNNQINFSVKPLNDGSGWVCSFVLYDQEHHFAGITSSDAVGDALEFLKTKGNIGSVEIMRVTDNG